MRHRADRSAPMRTFRRWLRRRRRLDGDPGFAGFEPLEPRLLLTNAPVLATPLANMAAPGDPALTMTFGVNGFDADGDALDITVESDDPNLRVVVPEDNRYAHFNFEENDGTPIGTIVAEVFETRGGDAAERIITLATNEVAANGDLDPNGTPFYTDVNVHRVADLTGQGLAGTIVQTGDKLNGNGTGGTPLGPFDDQFELQDGLGFFGPGAIAMANSGANTNNGQIFFANGELAHLNGLHMILGQIVEGFGVLNALIALGSNGSRMASVDIVQNTQDATVTVQGFTDEFGNPLWDGRATLTVTLDDGDPTTIDAVQQIDITADNVATDDALGARPTVTQIGGGTFLPPDVISFFQVADNAVNEIAIGARSSQPALGIPGAFDSNTNLLQLAPADGGDLIYDIDVLAVENGFADRQSSVTRFNVVSQSAGGPPVQGIADKTDGALSFGSFLNGDMLYTAQGSAGIQLFDVTDPSAPVLLDTFDTGGTARDIFVTNGTAFVADDDGGFISLDVSNPNDIQPLDVTSTNPSAGSLLIDGNTAYVPSLNNGLFVYDISNPSDITELTQVTLFNIPGIGDIPIILAREAVIRDDTLTLSDESFGLISFDVTNPADPDAIGTFGNDLRPIGLDIEGDTLYVADASGLVLFDISNPLAPVRLVTLPTPVENPPVNVEVENDLAVVSAPGGFFFIDVADPAAIAFNYVFGLSRLNSTGDATISIGGMPSISGSRVAMPSSHDGVLIMETAPLINEIGKGASQMIVDENGVEITINVSAAAPISFLRDADTDVVTQIAVGDADDPLTVADKAKITIKTEGGAVGTVDLFQVNGSANSFTALTFNPEDILFTGKITKVKMGDFADGHTFTIEGISDRFKDAVSFAFGAITDLVINSAMHIKTIKAVSWNDTGDEVDSINAPSLASAKFSGDADVAMQLNGGSSASELMGKPVLGKFKAGGAVNARGPWDVDGDIKGAKVGSTGPQFGIDAEGNVKKFDTRGNLNGDTLRANSWGKIKSKGDVNVNLIEATGVDAKGKGIGKFDAVNVGNTVATTIRSLAGALGKLKVVQFEDGLIDVDSAASLQSKGGDFKADVFIHAANIAADAIALGKASFKGAVDEAVWVVKGPTKKFATNTIGPNLSASFEALVGAMKIKGNASGDVAMAASGKVKIGGNLENARWLFGATWGDDGMVGGTDGDADTFDQTVLPGFDVKGNVTNSLVAVGPQPTDGTVLNNFDGGATIVGGAASAVTKMSVKGALDALSRFIAGLFPTSVKIGALKVNPNDAPNNPLAANFRVNPNDP